MTPDDPPGGAVPAVSVIIPAYNASATIGRQLAALSRQRVDAAWEVIVSDNGSTDRTADIAREWADRLPLRVVDASERRGPAAARNAGADAARAPLFAFCDADDEVTDEWLAHLLRALAEAEVVVACARVESPYSTPERPLYDLVTTLRMPFLPELAFGSSSRLALRAGAFAAVGGFDESLRTGEDVDLSWRLQLAGYHLNESPDALIVHHHRDGFAATVRQFAGYQRGRRQLRHRYARVIEEFDTARGSAPAAGWETGVVSAVQPAVQPPPSRMGRVMLYLRDGQERSQFARRTVRSLRLRAAVSLGLFLGRVVGRVDTSEPQVEASLARRYLERERPFAAPAE
ncbi:glycosyltransferase [Microbacterium sp. NPDC056003]|uniref:glycosyltransferase n=1 Tax=Microbacterium sp. NPDC056003 TaxID=3345676 RepID=UPI0035DA784D